VLIATAVAAMLGSTGSSSGALSVNPCTTTDHGGYTTMICLQAADESLSGEAPVGVTLTSSAAGTVVREVKVDLDGQHLLSDYEEPFDFRLPTYLFADGNHTLTATALLRDGSRTRPVSRIVAVSSGAQQPDTTAFAPTGGSAAGPGRPFVLAAVGDGADGEHEAAAVTNLIGSWRPNLFIYLGDVYREGTATEYINWYAPEEYFGRFRSITLPTLGDHEYTKRVAPGYFWYWRGAPHFYSVDAAGWHIVSLDSTTQFNQVQPETTQYEWLKQDLDAHPAACTLVFYHHPAFTVGPESPSSGRIVPLWQVLAARGVDLVLNGHDHDYQRFQPLDAGGNPAKAGSTEFVVGSGGHGIRAFVRQDTRLVRGADTARAIGALRLTLNPNGAGFEYVTMKGTLLDYGAVPCSGGGGDQAAPTQPRLDGRPGYRRATLIWRESSDDVGVVGYLLFRNGHLIARIGPRTTFADERLKPATSYRYRIAAIDESGRQSVSSNLISLRTPPRHRRPPAGGGG
jgi:hypothetical protein